MDANQKIIYARMIGLVVLILLGLIFHELYKSTEITLLGVISPINESKWEHWKMVFFPMLIVSIFEYHFIKDYVANYIFALALGIIVFELITFGLIELYGLFLGHSNLLVHVLTFVLGGVVGQTIRYIVMTQTAQSRFLLVIGLIILTAHLLTFSIFTFNPPRSEYFRDPINDSYGIYHQT
jgi:hypothetical protein